jgi:hypothetical protein
MILIILIVITSAPGSGLRSSNCGFGDSTFNSGAGFPAGALAVIIRQAWPSTAGHFTAMRSLSDGGAG